MSKMSKSLFCGEFKMIFKSLIWIFKFFTKKIMLKMKKLQKVRMNLYAPFVKGKEF